MKSLAAICLLWISFGAFGQCLFLPSGDFDADATALSIYQQCRRQEQQIQKMQEMQEQMLRQQELLRIQQELLQQEQERTRRRQEERTK